MNSRVLRFGFAATLFVVALAVTRPAAAEWPAAGRAVVTAASNQNESAIATDQAGGAVIVWQDARFPHTSIFARRVLGSGDPDPAWPVEGRAVLGDAAALATAVAGQHSPVVASDGTGGAIVAWQDARSAVTGTDVYAQHVLANGALDVRWPKNGRAISALAGPQGVPVIVADASGGAIIAWMDSRDSGGATEVFAHHVRNDGTLDPAWPADGLLVTTAPGSQGFPRIVADGVAGGAIVAWVDFDSSIDGTDVFAQHVRASGSLDPAWPAQGRALSLAAHDQEELSLAPDGAGGAIAAWRDNRDLVFHIFAQRVLASGQIAPGWPADGRALSTAQIGQTDPVLASDGAGGAIVAWEDLRNAGDRNLFVLRVQGSGAIDPAWPLDGRQVSVGTDESIHTAVVADAAAGAIVAWEQGSFVRVHHVRSTGALDPTFPSSGRLVRTVPTLQQSPQIVPAGPGSAIVAWTDRGVDADVFATLVPTIAAVDAPPGGGPTEIALAPAAPNPARGAVALTYALPRDADVSLGIFDVLGRRVRTLVSGARPAGASTVGWDLRDDSGTVVGAGVYFARLEADGVARTRAITRVE